MVCVETCIATMWIFWKPVNRIYVDCSEIWAHMTEISSFALINEFFSRGATERNTR